MSGRGIKRDAGVGRWRRNREIDLGQNDGNAVKLIIGKCIDKIAAAVCCIDGRCAVIGCCNWGCGDDYRYRCIGAIGWVRSFADFIVDGISACGRIGRDRYIARCRIKNDAGICGRRGDARGDFCRINCNATQHVIRKGVDDVWSAAQAADRSRAVIACSNRACLHGNRNLRICTVRGVQILTDFIVYGIGASGCSRRNRHLARRWVKRYTRVGCWCCNRCGHRAGNNRSTVQCVICKRIDKVGSPAQRGNRARDVICCGNRCGNDLDRYGRSFAIGRVGLFADLITDGVITRWRANWNRDIAGCGIKNWYRFTRRNRCCRRGDRCVQVTCDNRAAVDCVIGERVEYRRVAGRAINGCAAIIARDQCAADYNGHGAGCAIGRVDLFADFIVDGIAARRCARCDRHLASSCVQGDAGIGRWRCNA